MFVLRPFRGGPAAGFWIIGFSLRSRTDSWTDTARPPGPEQPRTTTLPPHLTVGMRVFFLKCNVTFLVQKVEVNFIVKYHVCVMYSAG